MGLTSTIEGTGNTICTLADSSDDYNRTDGHHHDDANVAHCNCRCSNGHQFKVYGKPPCPDKTCDFGKTPTRITVRNPDAVLGDEITVWPKEYGARFGRVARLDPKDGWVLERMR